MPEPQVFLAQGGRLPTQQGPGVAMLADALQFGAVNLLMYGYNVNATNGTQVYQINSPGDVKTLVGILLMSVNDDGAGGVTPVTTETISFQVNSDLVVQSVPASSLCPQAPYGFQNNGMPFRPIYRPISGNDNIKVTVQGTATKSLVMIVYYMP